MRVAILGAMGEFSEALVDCATASGRAVNLFSSGQQRPARGESEKLSLFRGDAETGEHLGLAVAGCEWVISAFDPQKPVFMTNLLPLLVTPPLRRFVFVSRLGVGDSMDQAKNASGFISALAPRVQRQIFEDYSQAEGVLRTSPLRYVILRGAALDAATAGQEVITTEAGGLPPSRIAPVDFAKFIVSVLDAPGWDCREVTVGTLRKTPKRA